MSDPDDTTNPIPIDEKEVDYDLEFAKALNQKRIMQWQGIQIDYLIRWDDLNTELKQSTHPEEYNEEDTRNERKKCKESWIKAEMLIRRLQLKQEMFEGKGEIRIDENGKSSFYRFQ